MGLSQILVSYSAFSIEKCVGWKNLVFRTCLSSRRHNWCQKHSLQSFYLGGTIAGDLACTVGFLSFVSLIVLFIMFGIPALSDFFSDSEATFTEAGDLIANRTSKIYDDLSPKFMHFNGKNESYKWNKTLVFRACKKWLGKLHGVDVF